MADRVEIVTPLRTLAVVAVLLTTALPPALAQTIDVLHSFDGNSFSSNSLSAGSKSLVAGQDGLLYGTTWYGGSSDAGTIFRMTSSGAVTVLHSFAEGAGGSVPSSLIQASDGRFYGTTFYGGAFNRGTLFRQEINGTVAILHSFGGPGGPSIPTHILQAADGRLYGRSSEYVDPSGTQSYSNAIFRISIDGSELTTLHMFAAADYVWSAGPFIQASDGTFVGVAPFGMNGYGGVFRMALDGTVTVLHAFAGGSFGSSHGPRLSRALTGIFTERLVREAASATQARFSG